MQLNIKNGEAYRIAKELADHTGESLTEAVTRALKERLERQRTERGSEGVEERFRKLQGIAERFDALPVLDDREPDDIVGYDENGLPT